MWPFSACMTKFFAHKHFIIALIACVVIFGVLYNANREALKEGAGALRSMRELMDSRGTETCKFTSLTPETDTNGVVYVSDGILRGDFVSTVRSATGGRVVESHLLADQSYFYIWSQSNSGIGMKIAISTMVDEGAPDGGISGLALFDITRKLDLHCMPWSKNPSLLVRPKGVSFQDMSGMGNALSDQQAVGKPDVNIGATLAVPIPSMLK